MNIVPEFSLNKHPFAVKNLSLLTAKNIKVDNDYSNVCNEESINRNDTITDFLTDYFTEEDEDGQKIELSYNIVGWIPCNTEVVIFAAEITNNGYGKTIICRYIEKSLTEEAHIDNHYYDKWEYSGGTILGAFTYNIDNSLIIIFSEYFDDNDDENNNKKIPVKTINLGNKDRFDEYYSDIQYELDKNLLPLCPSVRLPRITNLEYNRGYAYKGTYFLFIRFKITQYDYTQWYDIGFPIYVDDLKSQNLMKYFYDRPIPYHTEDEQKNGASRTTQPDSLNHYMTYYNNHNNPMFAGGYMVGCSDSFSVDQKVVNTSFSVNLQFDNITRSVINKYKYYQIGFICALQTENLCYRTDDIEIGEIDDEYTEDTAPIEKQFTLDISNLIECSVDELTAIYQNYYNTKVLYNYKNQIYIADYKELNLNENFQNKADNINSELATQPFYGDDNFYDFTLVNEQKMPTSSEKDGRSNISYGINAVTARPRQLELSKIFNIPDNQLITVYVDENTSYTNCAKNFIITIYKKHNTTLTAGFDYGYAKLFLINETTNDTAPIATSDGSDKNNTYFCIGSNENKITIFSGAKGDKPTIAFSIMRALFPKMSFYERLNHATLIPGEIYSFYVHYISDSGLKSNGYKIENKHKFYRGKNVDGVWDSTGNEITPVMIDNDTFVIFDFNDTVYETLDKLFTGELTELEYADSINFTKDRPDDLYVLQAESKIDDGTKGIIDKFKLKFYTFYNEQYKNVRWFEIVNPPKGYFGQYENINGERFFKIPVDDVEFEDSYENLISVDIPVHNCKHSTKYIQYYPIFKNIELPDNTEWKGFCFSMEKLEKQTIATGMLTRSDFISENAIVNVSDGTGQCLIRRDCANAYPSAWMNFYSDEFDIYDIFENAEPCVSFIEVSNDGQEIFKYQDTIQQNFIQPAISYAFPIDQNKPQISGVDMYNPYGIKEYIFAKGHDETKNRFGKGSCIIINDIAELFDNVPTAAAGEYYPYAAFEDEKQDENGFRVAIGKYGDTGDYMIPEGRNNIYKASIKRMSRSLYINKQKTLIRISDVIYMSKNQICDYARLIRGLIAHYTIAGVLVYNNRGVVLDGNRRFVTNKNENQYYPKRNSRQWTDSNEDEDFVPMDGTWMNDTPFVAYVQYYLCDNKMHESKVFNNGPSSHGFSISTDDENDGRQLPGCIVEPQNSIDLFKNPIGVIDDIVPVTYMNYQEDIEYPYSYSNTIRRSNVIQDESLLNSWRLFELEEYKMLNDNLGGIINIIAIDKKMYIHCEHSLFMLNADPTLKTEEKNLSFSQQDVFDVEYNDILPSNLGFAGLQDRKSFIYDTFGYMFYDESARRLFLYQKSSIKLIDDDIKLWLHKYDPHNVRFCNDRKNSRVLIKMDYKVNGEDKLIVLSFNYKLNKFISLHDYYFDESISTKNISYLFCSNLCNSHDYFCNFVQTGEEYGKFVNIKGSDGSGITLPSKIGIVYNDQYDYIKYLDSITYKLNKKNDCQNVDYTDEFEEFHETPFAGDILKVYNNILSTGELNIAIDNEEEKNKMLEKDMPYLKPYWQLGNWNFSFIRDKGEQYSKFWKKINDNIKYVNPDNMARMYGNYFIIEFLFDNEKNNNRKIEFERLICNISKN